ncbi:hypothetical protein DFP73DRAFT_523295 [Morchella snyderi]|nr:hypothetical protein DFP73DRAFT_523295 [Morchella snyderi]
MEHFDYTFGQAHNAQEHKSGEAHTYMYACRCGQPRVYLPSWWGSITCVLVISSTLVVGNGHIALRSARLTPAKRKDLRTNIYFRLSAMNILHLTYIHPLPTQPTGGWNWGPRPYTFMSDPKPEDDNASVCSRRREASARARGVSQKAEEETALYAHTESVHLEPSLM